MASTDRSKVAARWWERHLPAAIAAAVSIGLLVSTGANIWIEPPAQGGLPGVALGSQALLIVERALAFFTAWMVALVVLVHAIAGRLPIEISGRGVRYADASTTEDMARATDTTIARMEAELASYRQEQNELRRLLKGAATDDRI